MGSAHSSHRSAVALALIALGAAALAAAALLDAPTTAHWAPATAPARVGGFMATRPANLQPAAQAMWVPRTAPIAAGATGAEGEPSLIQDMVEDEFDAVVAGSTPVLVDYYATWCGPCRLMEPKVQDIARQYAGKLKVYKLDCGTNGNKCKDLGIKMLPTFHVWKNGEMLDQMFGTNSEKLDSMVKAAVA
jgi:thioredoxin 1